MDVPVIRAAHPNNAAAQFAEVLGWGWASFHIKGKEMNIVETGAPWFGMKAST
jgi:hypothetical protein